MKKKHKKKPHKFRNAASAPPRAPRAPRAPSASRAAPSAESKWSRLGWTAAGAGATALVGSFLAREGWAPKTISGVMGIAGGVATAASHDPRVQDAGSGALSAAGSQFLLLMMDDHEQGKAIAATAANANRRQADADGLPQGALASAFERARARLAVGADDARRYSDAA